MEYVHLENCEVCAMCKGKMSNDAWRWRVEPNLQCWCWCILICWCCWKFHIEQDFLWRSKAFLGWREWLARDLHLPSSVFSFWRHWKDYLWQCEKIYQLCCWCWCLQSQVIEVNAQPVWLQVHNLWQACLDSTRDSQLDWCAINQQKVSLEGWMVEAWVHLATI